MERAQSVPNMFVQQNCSHKADFFIMVLFFGFVFLGFGLGLICSQFIWKDNIFGLQWSDYLMIVEQNNPVWKSYFWGDYSWAWTLHWGECQKKIFLAGTLFARSIILFSQELKSSSFWPVVETAIQVAIITTIVLLLPWWCKELRQRAVCGTGTCSDVVWFNGEYFFLIALDILLLKPPCPLVRWLVRPKVLHLVC